MIMINHHFPDSRPRPQKCYEEAPRSFVLKSCSSLMKGSWVRKKRGVASHKFVTSFLDSSLCPLCDKLFAIHVWGCPCRNVIESYYLDNFKALDFWLLFKFTSKLSIQKLTNLSFLVTLRKMLLISYSLILCVFLLWMILKVNQNLWWIFWKTFDEL